MLWICSGCTTQYSVDAPCCPHCGSVERREYSDAVREEGARLATGGVLRGDALTLIGEGPEGLVVPKGRSANA